MPATLVKTYDARLDTKHRLTLRGAKHTHFRVRQRKDGIYELRPLVLAKPEHVIVPKTLRCIKASLASMKAGKRSKPVDLKKLAAMKL